MTRGQTSCNHSLKLKTGVIVMKKTKENICYKKHEQVLHSFSLRCCEEVSSNKFAEINDYALIFFKSFNNWCIFFQTSFLLSFQAFMLYFSSGWCGIFKKKNVSSSYWCYQPVVLMTTHTLSCRHYVFVQNCMHKKTRAPRKLHWEIFWAIGFDWR